MIFNFLVQILLFHCFQTENILDSGYLKTCPDPIVPKNAVISNLAAHRTYSDNSKNSEYGVDEYHELDTVYFRCEDGYSQIDNSIMYVTCGSNGKWFPAIENAGKCLTNRKFERCTSGLFRCRSERNCISAHLRCDCYNDCADGSDEENCETKQRHIRARNDGMDSSGLISSPGYPLKYPNDFSCIYHIYTLPTYRIELKFEEFNIAHEVRGECKDYVRINGINSISQRNHFYQSSQTKCGEDKFKRVFSNFTHISINVSLGNLKQYRQGYRGFVLTWQVRSLAFVRRAIMKSRREVKRLLATSTKKSSDKLHTVLTPIIISAVLPISLILFLCFHRQRIRLFFKNKNEKNKKKKEARKASSSCLMLTTDNLQKFNDANMSDIDLKSKRTLHIEEREQFLQKQVKVRSTAEGFSQTLLLQQHNKTRSSSHGNSRESYNSSNHSDHPRYVMSYDVISKQDINYPIPIISDNILHRQCNNNYNNINFNRRSISPKFSDSQPSRSKSSKDSRDNGHSSRNSKSQSSCTFCNHRKSLKRPKRMSPVGYESNDTGQVVNTSDLEELHNFNEYKETLNPFNVEFSQIHSLYEDQENERILRTNVIETMELCSNPLLYENLDSKKDYNYEHPSRLIKTTTYNSCKSNFIKSPSDFIPTPSDFIQSPSDFLQTPSNFIQSQSDFIPSPSDCDNNGDGVFYKTRGGSIICTH